MAEQTFSYLSSTEADVTAMLERVGVDSLEALFEGIPASLRLQGELHLPPSADELRLDRDMRAMARENRAADNRPCFLGAGMYDHFIPSAVRHLAGRSEFWTAYTPYQPEMSQGMLQAIFEYQSLVAALYGMDGANASLYDGATAMTEGALLALRVTGRNRLLVSRGIHPEYRRVLADTLRHIGVDVQEIPVDPATGQTRFEERDGRAPDAASSGSTSSASAPAAMLLPSPNFFGVVENVRAGADMAHEMGALCVVSADPVSLGLLQAPGRLGADICTGEGQPLGLPMNFGGPGLGLFTVKTPLLRQMPGRIVGETKDIEGRRGFVLTLQAREQHIRRERAASNICTNQALCALTATIHLSLLGPDGLRSVAQDCLDNAVSLYNRLIDAGLAEPVFSGPFFREFAVWPVLPPAEMNAVLAGSGFLGGLDLAAHAPETTSADGRSAWLLAVTEKRTPEEMDRFCEVLLADDRIRFAVETGKRDGNIRSRMNSVKGGSPV